MTGCVVLTLLVLFALFSPCDANPTISTSTPTPCYGDVVTLVCHHPEVPDNPGRYFTTTPIWREDGVGITPFTGVYLQAVPDLTRTTLTINITVDHFRNKSFNYSCLLALAGENGLPTGEVETSGEVTVDPVDQLPIPRRASTFSNSTTAVLTVSFDPRCCNTSQLNVDITTTSSSATTPVVLPVDSTDPTNTTIVITDITEGVCYTASIQSVCEDNSLLEDSGVLVVNFDAQPGPPEVTITTTDSTITLTWNTALHCFESEMFTFVVIWNEIGSGTSTNVTTSSSPYTISGLQPGTSYQISELVVGESGVISRTTVFNVTTSAETPTRGGGPTTAVAIVVVVLGIIPVVVVTGIVLMVAHCRKRRVQGDNDTGSRAHDPNPPASSNPFSGRLSGTCCYTTIDFESSNPTPIPPPPVEGVTYAEPVAVGEKESQTLGGETKPELPTKQPPHHNIEDFRSDVVDALMSIGVDYSGAVETGGVPHFTAEYNGIHFSVTCVYTSIDVTLEDVGHILEATQVTGSTKGLLISNQSTIPSECLLTLEDAGCQFVPVSGYGEEGWEDRMINKVKDVFLKEANDDSESEDLLTSEQEDQPSSIQPGTGPAPVSNNNNIVDKRWTMPDEHCVESREETPPRHNDCSTSTFRSPEDEELNIVKNECYVLGTKNVKDILSGVANDDSESEDCLTSVEEIIPPLYDNQSGSLTVANDGSEKKDLMAIVHETRPPLTDDQRVKHIFPRLINDLSESEDLPTSEQVMNILSNVGSCTPTFELFAEVSRDGESSIGKRKNGGGAASFQEPLPKRKGSKDGAQDVEENALTKLRKFISKTCEKVNKAGLLKWAIWGAGLLLIGTLIYCGPGSPGSHLGTKTPESHFEVKTHQPMWELVIAGCDWDGNKTEQVPVSHVIALSEQDIQDEANLEHLLNPLLWMILQKGNILRVTCMCHSTHCLPSTETKTTNHDASLPNIFVQY